MKPQNLICPRCGGPMVSRTNQSEGSRFWGCQNYPKCRGTRDTDGNAPGDLAREDQPQRSGDDFTEDERREARKGLGGFRSRRYE